MKAAFQEQALAPRGNPGNAMTTGPGPELQLILAHDAGGGRVAVELNSFVEFDLTITRSLRKLVQNWPHKRPQGAAQGRISQPGKTPPDKRKPK
jgi:hypothetical protein